MDNDKTKDKDLKINEQESRKKGLLGLLETLLRKLPNVSYVFLLSPILVMFVICVGASLTPGALIFLKVEEITRNGNLLLRAFGLGCSLGLGFFLYGLTIIFIVPLFNLPFIPFVRSYRGPWFSLESIPWYIHNALTYLVRYTILDLMTPSPINLLFYKMMGLKIGKNVMINSTNISDPCLIELDDYVVIGGSASLMAHYGMKGYLIIDKLIIGKGTTVGLNANIMGGVRIGEKCTITPNAVVLPKTVIPDHTKYGME